MADLKRFLIARGESTIQKSSREKSDEAKKEIEVVGKNSRKCLVSATLGGRVGTAATPLSAVPESVLNIIKSFTSTIEDTPVTGEQVTSFPQEKLGTYKQQDRENQKKANVNCGKDRNLVVGKEKHPVQGGKFGEKSQASGGNQIPNRTGAPKDSDSDSDSTSDSDSDSDSSSCSSSDSSDSSSSSSSDLSEKENKPPGDSNTTFGFPRPKATLNGKIVIEPKEQSVKEEPKEPLSHYNFTTNQSAGVWNRTGAQEHVHQQEQGAEFGRTSQPTGRNQIINCTKHLEPIVIPSNEAQQQAQGGYFGGRSLANLANYRDGLQTILISSNEGSNVNNPLGYNNNTTFGYHHPRATSEGHVVKDLVEQSVTDKSSKESFDFITIQIPTRSNEQLQPSKAVLDATAPWVQGFYNIPPPGYRFVSGNQQFNCIREPSAYAQQRILALQQPQPQPGIPSKVSQLQLRAEHLRRHQQLLKQKKFLEIQLDKITEAKRQVELEVELTLKRVKSLEPSPPPSPPSAPPLTPRPIPTPTPIPIPTSIPTPIRTPIPTPTPIPIPTPILKPTPIPIPTPITTPIPRPTPTPRPIPTPSTIPIQTSIPIPTPKPTPRPVQGQQPQNRDRNIQLYKTRVKQLEDLKLKEEQVAHEREFRLKRLQQDESKTRDNQVDIERQLRLHLELYNLKLKEDEEIRVLRLQNPNYQPPTKKELKQQRKLQRQQEQQQKFQKPGAVYQGLNPLPKPKMMHNEMVSIPVANLNGGLKATSSGSGVGTGGVVSSAVLANAPRVYLTPTATFMANRQAAAAAQVAAATGKIGGGTIVGGSVASSSAAASASGTVRYFSQFSKLQTVGGAPSLQKKLANGDTIVLSNGSKGRILTTSERSSISGGIGGGIGGVTTTATTAAAVATNGSSIRCLQTTKMDLMQPEGTVINNNAEEKAIVANTNQQEQPLELVTGQQTNSSDSDEPELDITINNVVCSFSVRCHLKLRDIALNGANVEYRRENGMVTMKLRHPYTTASIWSSGRITCTGATSEPMAKVAARRYARCLGKLGFPTRFQNFRIVNVLGTCSMPWAIKIVNFSERHRENASYEPELHPGVTYKMIAPKATLKIFSTGSITVTAASVNDVESAIQHIYPLVFEFRKQRSPEELQHLRQKQRQMTGATDPNELEEIIVSENKAAAVDDIFVNTTAAHTTKAAAADQANSSGAAGGVAAASIDSVQRLKQLEVYRHMRQQTQEERRHIPFHGNTTNTTTATALSASKPSAAASSSSSSTADNICASARRRATECWATKLQNKRPRYNDPSTAAAAGSTTTKNAASSASTSNSFSNVASTSAAAAAAAVHLRNPLKTAALANARMRGAGGMPVNLVLNQSSSSSSSASRLGTISSGSGVSGASGASGSSGGFLQYQQRLQRLMHHQQPLKTVGVQQTSFSPSDFQVDDLIEEEETNELDDQY